jgi:hypothetical protein
MRLHKRSAIQTFVSICRCLQSIVNRRLSPSTDARFAKTGDSRKQRRSSSSCVEYRARYPRFASYTSMFPYNRKPQRYRDISHRRWPKFSCRASLRQHVRLLLHYRCRTKQNEKTKIEARVNRSSIETQLRTMSCVCRPHGSSFRIKK